MPILKESFSEAVDKLPLTAPSPLEDTDEDEQPALCHVVWQPPEGEGVLISP